MQYARPKARLYFICGRSSAGRAPPCQGGCREFESRRPLSTPVIDPRRPDFRFRAIGAAVARFPDTEEVTGSIPVSPTQQLPGAAFLLPAWPASTLQKLSQRLGTPNRQG
jgi:hypothetical protein